MKEGEFLSLFRTRSQIGTSSAWHKESHGEAIETKAFVYILSLSLFHFSVKRKISLTIYSNQISTFSSSLVPLYILHTTYIRTYCIHCSWDENYHQICAILGNSLYSVSFLFLTPFGRESNLTLELKGFNNNNNISRSHNEKKDELLMPGWKNGITVSLSLRQ